MIDIKDFKTLIGKEFEVDILHEVAFDHNHYIYKIAAYMGRQVLIKWNSEFGPEKTTYTKEEVVENINKGIWLIK